MINDFNCEIDDKFNKLKIILNHLLKLYLEEIIGKTPKSNRKDIFIEALNNFDIKEKRLYRDYLYGLIKKSIQMENFSNEEYKSEEYEIGFLFNIMKGIDKLEVYAGVCNNCKPIYTQISLIQI